MNNLKKIVIALFFIHVIHGDGLTVMDFNGSTQYTSLTPGASNIIFNAPSTISIWMRPNTLFSGSAMALFSISDGTARATAGSESFGILYGNSTSTIDNETISVMRILGSDADPANITLWGVSEGVEYQYKWTHVAVVCASSVWTVYINGNAKTLTQSTYWSGTSRLYGDSFSPKGTAALGAYVTSGIIQYFNGQLEDARVYNRALSAQEIQSLALSGRRLNITDGLVGYWGLDEGEDGQVSGGTGNVLDRSGNGNHGNPVNGVIWRASPNLSYQ